MKKKTLAILIASVTAVIAAVVIAVLVFGNGDYEVQSVLTNDGMLIGDENIYASLFAEGDTDVIEEITPVYAEQSDYIYKKSGKYYVGNDKQDFIANYPLAINNAAALMFTNSISKLITGSFEYVDSYEGLYLSNGITFNADMERAYREEFILIDLGNGLYMNAVEIDVTGSLTQEGTISANSIIRFADEKIAYYSFDGEKYAYGILNPVAMTAKITLGGYSFSYVNFLERLGLYREKKDNSGKKVATPTPEPVLVVTAAPVVPTDKPVVSATPMPTQVVEAQVTDSPVMPTGNPAGPVPTNSGSDDRPKLTATPGAGQATKTPTPSPTNTPVSTPTPSPEIMITPMPAPTPLPADNPNNPVDPSVVKPTSTPKPTNTPRPTYTPRPTFTPLPQTDYVFPDGGNEESTSAPAATAMPAATVPPAEDNAPTPTPVQETVTSTPLPVFREWAMPEVRLGEPTAGVYSVTFEGFEVDNPEYLWTPYVQFVIKDASGDTVLVKSINGGGAITLTPLRPNSEYTVDVGMTYVDAYGYRRFVHVDTISVRTKAVSELDQLHLTWTNGQKLPNAIDLKNIGITEVITNTDNRFIESSYFLSRVEIYARNVSDHSNNATFVLSPSFLKKMKSGILFEFISNKTLKPNSTYEYSFRLIDRFGNEVPVSDPFTGVYSTCIDTPSARFTTEINTVNDLELKVNIINPGNAPIRNIYVYAQNYSGDTVVTTAGHITAGGTVGTEMAENHLFTADEISNGEAKFKFTGLNDKEIYYFYVYADFDLKDYDENATPEADRWHNDMLLGRAKVTTAALASLGSVYLDSEISDLENGRAFVSVAINSERTKSELIRFLDDITLSIVEAESGAASNARIEYRIVDKGSTDYAGVDAIMSEISAAQQTELANLDNAVTLANNAYVRACEHENSCRDAYEIKINRHQEATEEAQAYTEATEAKNAAYDALSEARENRARFLLTLETGADASARGSIVIPDTEIAELCNGKELRIAITGLKTNMHYTLKGVSHGSIGSNVRNITTVISNSSLRMYKAEAKVKLSTYYASSTFISLFGVSIDDPDDAITEYPIKVYLYNSNYQILEIKTIRSKDEVSELRFNGLEIGKEYTFRFFATEYNKGWVVGTAEKGREIFVNQRTSPLVISTGETISGECKLLEITDQPELVPEKRMMIDKTNTFTISTSYPSGKCYKYSNKRMTATNVEYAVVKINADFGDTYYNAFEICNYANKSWYTTYQMFDDDPYKDSDAIALSDPYTLKIDGNGRDMAYDSGQYIPLKQALTGRQTLYLVMTSTHNSTDTSFGVYPLYGVVFHMFGNNSQTNLNANIQVKVTDQAGQLGSEPGYSVRVYSKARSTDNYSWIATRLHTWSQTDEEGKCEMKMYDYNTGSKGQMLDMITFDGTVECADASFSLPVSENKYYKLEIWIDIRGYNILIGSMEFTTEESVHPIYNEYDLMSVMMNPNGHYIVLNDITLTYNNITSSVPFNGVIDFNGHTVKHANNNYMFLTIGNQGVIKNLVYTYPDDWGNAAARRVDSGIAYYNYGTLQNIKVVYKNGNFGACENNMLGQLAYVNYQTGVIENFAIDMQSDVKLMTRGTLGVYQNRGTVRNGYVYSSTGAKMTHIETLELMVDRYKNYWNSTEAAATSKYAENVFISGAVFENWGTVENVISMVNIEAAAYRNLIEHCCTVVSLNEGTVKNCLSTGKVKYAGAVRLDDAIAVYNYKPNAYEYGTTSGIKYYSESNLGNDKTAEKVYKELLHSEDFYTTMFDESGSSSVGVFRNSMALMGYYPQLIWPECMPVQDYISLPEIDTSQGAVNILSAQVLENTDEMALIKLTLYNPNLFKIRTLAVQGISSVVLDQYADGEFYYVTARLLNPASYYSSYEITGFTYALSTGVGNYSKSYEEGDRVKVAAEFYKPITTYLGFAEIRNNLDQNYRLYADIDFFGKEITEFYVYEVNTTNNGKYNADYDENSFAGKLDGNGHTLSNIDLGSAGFVFGKVTGSIYNLNIENMHTPDLSIYGNVPCTSAYIGFIAQLRTGGLIKNVHFNNVFLENITCYGGTIAARNSFDTMIVDSSVRNAVLKTNISTNAESIRLGGFVGQDLRGLTIKNSFVDGMSIDALLAGDVLGIGGLVGVMVNGTQIENVYVSNTVIDTNYSNVGGITGFITTVSSYNYYEDTFLIKNYFTDVTINTFADNVGGTIGYTIKNSGNEYAYGLNLGKIVKKSLGIDGSTVKPIYGRYDLTTYNLGKNQFAYEKYTIDGIPFEQETGEETELSKRSYIKTITYDEITSVETYGYEDDMIRPKLAWAKDFKIDSEELSNGILPKLMYSDGSGLLPNQPNVSLKPQTIEIESVSIGGTQAVPIVTILLKHASNIEVSDVNLEGIYFDTSSPSNHTVTEILDSDGTKIGTRVWGYLAFDGYLDKYFLTGVRYKVNGAGPELTQNEYVDLGLEPRYLEIANIDEWNRFLSSSMYGNKFYNIKLTGDIIGNPSKYNVIENGIFVNNIIGSKNNTGAPVEISNINIFKSGATLVKQATGNISNINFHDIILMQPYSESGTQYLSGNFGIIGSVNGDVFDCSFSDIDMTFYRSTNVGLIGLAYGDIHDIFMENITILEFTTASYNNRGGLVGRLSGFGSINNVTARNIYVEACGNYTGGILGYQSNGCNIYGISAENVVVISKGGSNIGGIVGYAGARTTQEHVGDFQIKNVFVYGGNQVGGIGGVLLLGGGNNNEWRMRDKISNLEYDNVRSNIENVFVLCRGTEGGGAVGYGGARRVDAKNVYVFGKTNYFGGIIGSGAVVDCSIKDSIVSAVSEKNDADDGYPTAFYDPSTSTGYFFDWKNDMMNVIADYETAGETDSALFWKQTLNVLTHVSSPDPSYTLSKWGTLRAKLTTLAANNNMMRKNAVATGAFTSFVKSGSQWGDKTSANVLIGIGGIAGRTALADNCVVNNCEIGSYRATDVGGIVGRFGPWINCSSVGIYGSASIDSVIFGGENVGGIAGRITRYYSTGTYSNSTVEAKPLVYNGTVIRTGNNAGGIVGYLKLTESTNFNDTPRIAQTYFAGNVTGASNVGGIIGLFDQKFYSTTSDYGWVMLGNVYYTNVLGIANLIYNQAVIPNPGTYRYGVLYEDSKLILLNAGSSNTITTGKQYATTKPSNNKSYTAAQFKEKTTFTSNGFSTDTDIMSNTTNYKTRYWIYDDLVNGKLPALRMNGSNNYDRATAIRRMAFQPSLNIPGLLGRSRMLASKSVMSAQAARATLQAEQKITGVAYASGVDTINIDFSETNPSAVYELVIGRETLTGIVNERTITVGYDYMKDVTLTVSFNGNVFEKTWYSEDLCRDIMVYKYDYYYIDENGISGSKPTVYGDFIHMFDGKAITASGDITDLYTGDEFESKVVNAKECPTGPLFTGTYGGKTILTFHEYSVVLGDNGETVRDGFLLYTDGSVLEAVSRAQKTVPDACILDSDDIHKYYAVLGTDGSITVMGDSEFKLPSELDNSAISCMSSSFNANSPYAVLRYENGDVTVFNFITGEILDGHRAARGSAVSMLMSLFERNDADKSFQSSYLESRQLADALNSMAWTNPQSVEDNESLQGNPSAEIIKVNENTSDKGNADLIQNALAEKPEDICDGELTPEDDNHEYAGSDAETTEKAENATDVSETKDTTENSETNKDKTSEADKTHEINPINPEGYAGNGEVEHEDGTALGGGTNTDNGTNTECGVVTTPVEGEDVKLPEIIYAEDSNDEQPESGSENGADEVEDNSEDKSDASEKNESEKNEAENVPVAADTDDTKPDDSEKSDDDYVGDQLTGQLLAEKLQSEVLYRNENLAQTEVKYISVYNPDSGVYELYNEKDLLEKPDEELVSVNTVIKSSGQVIDYHKNYTSNANNTAMSWSKGMLLVAISTIAALVLTGALIVVKRKEA